MGEKKRFFHPPLSTFSDPTCHQVLPGLSTLPLLFLQSHPNTGPHPQIMAGVSPSISVPNHPSVGYRRNPPKVAPRCHCFPVDLNSCTVTTLLDLTRFQTPLPTWPRASSAPDTEKPLLALETESPSRLAQASSVPIALCSYLDVDGPCKDLACLHHSV